MVCAVAFTAFISYGRNEAVRNKARYFFVEGQRKEAENKRDAALHLYKKAWQTDPAYEEAAYRYGRLRLQIPTDTFQSEREIRRSFSMLRAYVDAFPEDGEESIYYGYVAAQLDSLDAAERVFNRAYRLDPTQSNALLYLSEAMASNGKFKNAAEALSRFEKAEGKNPSVSMRKISYYLAAEDTTEAVAEVDKLIESNPRDASYYVLKGNLYDAIQKPDTAVLYYLDAERLDPESVAAKLSLADYYREKGDSVAYDNKIYELLLSEDFNLEEKTGLLAQYLQTLISDRNDTGRGDYLFSVLNDQYPHEAGLLNLSARFNSARGNFKKAEEQIRYALDMEPENAKMWGQLMTYQAGDDRPADALSSFEEAKNHIVPDLDLKTLYGIMAVQAKEYKKAEAMYESMIHDLDAGMRTDTLVSLRDVRKNITLADLDRMSAIYTMYGDALHSAGEKEKSYMMYENAEELNPDNALAYNNHAYFLCIEGGDLDKALQLSKKALGGRSAGNPTYIDTHAWILYLKGDYEEAEKEQRKAIEILDKAEEEAPEIYDHFGDILMKNGKSEEAVKAWEKALEQKPENEADILKKLNK